MILLESFYNLSIWLYKQLVMLAAIFNKKAKELTEGHKIIKLKYSTSINNDHLIWFHCASLGEFEQGRPLIEKFKRENPEVHILLTFFSPSGYEIRKNYKQADYISYLPFDLPKEVNAFLNYYNPKLAIFIKYEFWRNFISELNKRDIPVYSVSTIFRKDQVYFKKNILGGKKKFSNEVLFNFSHFFVQDVNSAELLESIGIENFTVTGDTRFDRVKDVVNSVKQIDLVSKFKNDTNCFILGSVWKEDLEVLIPFMLKTGDKNIKFIIAPHEIHEKEIRYLKEKLGNEAIIWSEAVEEQDWIKSKYLIVDHVGSLSSLYQYANYCFIGGAFRKGLHNILEPASFGMPIFFGNKNYKKFKEATDLIDLEVAFPIANSIELENNFNVFLNDHQVLLKTAENCRNYVINKTGATEKIYDFLKAKKEWQT